jgi:ferric-dicitrate binding protein FerR (iron transport regulator)
MNEELIQRFFSGACTPEEARQVADYLKAHPEILEKYVSEEEFIQYTTEGDLPEKVSSQWLSHIHKETVYENNQSRWLRRIAVAAVLCGIIAGAAYLFMRPKSSQLTVVEPKTTIEKEDQERKENTSAQNMTLVLPDGSRVRLMPGSVVVYAKNFTENRNIYLEGEADFDVVHDKLHAFMVHSDELSTKVFGTSFHVKAIKGDNTITVRLFTGKIMVNAEVQKKRTIDSLILAPGQELVYNRREMTATVKYFNPSSANTMETLVKAGNEHKGTIKPDWYKFSSQPMTSVLDQLSDYYGVEIYYYPADVQHINFEGKFEKTDSLEKILTDITLPNNLQFVREKNGYIIKKK